jgi:hypothetical protein
MFGMLGAGELWKKLSVNPLNVWSRLWKKSMRNPLGMLGAGRAEKNNEILEMLGAEQETIKNQYKKSPWNGMSGASYEKPMKSLRCWERNELWKKSMEYFEYCKRSKL